jgi:hypothetical protein
MTDATTGLLMLPARSYDPGQGRFTSRDTANVFNHYQAFSTNPIVNTDPTGHFSLADLLIDIGVAIVFIVATVATAGAAATALPAVIGMEAGALTASTIAFTAATAVGAVASATGAITSVVKMADDIDDAVSHKHFLSKSARSAIGTIQIVAGAVAGVAGLGSLGATAAGAGADIAESAVQDAKVFLSDPLEDVDPDPTKRYAVVEGASDDDGIDSVLDGPSSGASESESVTPSTSRSLTAQDTMLKGVTGARNVTDADAAVIDSDHGLSTSVHADDASESSWEGHPELTQSTEENGVSTGYPNPYTHDAVEGDWDMETTVRYGQKLYHPKSYEFADLADLMLASDDEVSASEGLFPDGIYRGIWNSEWGNPWSK